MKNKYMILALLPVLFQGTLYCDDIDQMIMPQLQSAQTLMKSTKIALELQPILDALVSFAKRDKDKAIAAVNQMKSIKALLSHYREEEQKAWSQGSKTWWDWFLGRNPEKVEKEIDPAITKVNNALNTLNTNSSKLGYTIAASAAAAIAIAGIASAALWYINDSTTTNVQDYLIAGKNYANAANTFIDNAYNKINKGSPIWGNEVSRIKFNTATAFSNARTTNSIDEMKTACKIIENAVDQVFSMAQAYYIDLGTAKPDPLMLD